MAFTGLVMILVIVWAIRQIMRELDVKGMMKNKHEREREGQ